MTPDISVAAQQRSLSLGKGLMFAETLAHTNGQTLGMIIYKIRPSVAYSYIVIAADTLRDLMNLAFTEPGP